MELPPKIVVSSQFSDSAYMPCRSHKKRLNFPSPTLPFARFAFLQSKKQNRAVSFESFLFPIQKHNPFQPFERGQGAKNRKSQQMKALQLAVQKAQENTGIFNVLWSCCETCAYFWSTLSLDLTRLVNIYQHQEELLCSPLYNRFGGARVQGQTWETIDSSLASQHSTSGRIHP